jgi:uncharacterized HAD superfamily protein
MAVETPKIYVDFDDVLCATALGFLRILRREFGKTVAFDDIIDFDLGRSFDLDDAELERFFEFVHEDDALAGFEPLEGAVEALSDWKASGYEIEVVTGRPLETRAASRAWLAAHEVPYDDLIFVEKYDHARGGTPLEEIVARDYAWVVEDSFATAERLALGGQLVCLLDRPWNRIDSSAGASIARCADWGQVRRHVNA